MIGWDRIVALGLALPGVALGTSYGRPALKVRGKTFACTGKTDDHCVLMLPLDEVELLIESAPECFFQTKHHVGWPAVLTRYAAADAERIAALLERAWAARASALQRKARPSPS